MMICPQNPPLQLGALGGQCPLIEQGSRASQPLTDVPLQLPRAPLASVQKEPSVSGVPLHTGRPVPSSVQPKNAAHGGGSPQSKNGPSGKQSPLARQESGPLQPKPSLQAAPVVTALMQVKLVHWARVH